MTNDLQMTYLYTILHGYPYRPLYDCSNKTVEEWYATGTVQLPLGLYFLITGVILEMLYCPCLAAMVQLKLLNNSCYKLMFFLGFLDMSSIFVNSIMTGYFAIEGTVFCTNPILLITLGAFGCSCWCASCLTCVLLALSRCADLSESKFMKMCFKGNRVYFLIFITVLYLLFIMFFTTPASFNSNYVSWFFNPMNGHEASSYYNIYHTINNIVVSISITLLYIYLCIKFYSKTNSAISKVGRFQKQKKEFLHELTTIIQYIARLLSIQIFIQSFLICFINVIAAYIYVYMQFFSPPKWVVVVGQIAWQLSSGFVCIIYLTINGTIRGGVMRMIFPKKWMDQTFGQTVNSQYV
ncbi:hypothetical protein DICVIV_00994 [Dictyocaulus viviparus]|uniref:G-protein coupled receptors family 1 profile domain-containing protein n=1 Tax=Dictyocaulus viviparus TaxID=29172 RepID=A0A0D8Y9B8_DICVI|nr:hypothetical protein DICVIV_00994 [Dictyocaulus viviparus]